MQDWDTIKNFKYTCSQLYRCIIIEVSLSTWIAIINPLIKWTLLWHPRLLTIKTTYSQMRVRVWKKKEESLLKSEHFLCTFAFIWIKRGFRVEHTLLININMQFFLVDWAVSLRPYVVQYHSRGQPVVDSIISRWLNQYKHCHSEAFKLEYNDVLILDNTDQRQSMFRSHTVTTLQNV